MIQSTKTDLSNKQHTARSVADTASRIPGPRLRAAARLSTAGLSLRPSAGGLCSVHGQAAHVARRVPEINASTVLQP